MSEYVYSDDRKSLAQEIAEGLKNRGHWTPKETAGPDLITAIFLALAKQEEKIVLLEKALEHVTSEAAELDRAWRCRRRCAHELEDQLTKSRATRDRALGPGDMTWVGRDAPDGKDVV